MLILEGGHREVDVVGEEGDKVAPRVLTWVVKVDAPSAQYALNCDRRDVLIDC